MQYFFVNVFPAKAGISSVDAMKKIPHAKMLDTVFAKKYEKLFSWVIL